MKKIQVLILALLWLPLLIHANVAQTSGALPEKGKAAPNFTLLGHEDKPVSLKDYRGKWLVLYFYQKDFSSGCTTEARNFQRDLARYEKAGAIILGVSTDTVESHRNFRAKEGLGFTLLSDPEAKVASHYGAAADYAYRKLASRTTFLIDPQGRIAKVYPTVPVERHSEDVLAALAELQAK
jgi:peroxiredoxin Q/BCP